MADDCYRYEILILLIVTRYHIYLHILLKLTNTFNWKSFQQVFSF